MRNLMAHRATERILTAEERDIVSSALVIYHGHCLKQLSRIKFLGDHGLMSLAAARFSHRADATANLVTTLGNDPRVVLRW